MTQELWLGSWLVPDQHGKTTSWYRSDTFLEQYQTDAGLPHTHLTHRVGKIGSLVVKSHTCILELPHHEHKQEFKLYPDLTSTADDYHMVNISWSKRVSWLGLHGSDNNTWYAFPFITSLCEVTCKCTKVQLDTLLGANYLSSQSQDRAKNWFTSWQTDYVNGVWDNQSVLYGPLPEPHNSVVAAALALGPPHLEGVVGWALCILWNEAQCSLVFASAC